MCCCLQDRVKGVHACPCRLGAEHPGVARWDWRPAQAGELDRAAALLRDGLNPSQMAAELGISKAKGYATALGLAYSLTAPGSSWGTTSTNRYAYIDTMIQFVEDSHQPVDCKAIELHLADTRKVRRRNSSFLACCTYRQLALVENIDDLCRKESL